MEITRAISHTAQLCTARAASIMKEADDYAAVLAAHKRNPDKVPWIEVHEARASLEAMVNAACLIPLKGLVP